MSDIGRVRSVLGGLDGIVDDLRAFYRDLPARPELSLQEHCTAEKAAERGWWACCAMAPVRR